MIFNFFRKETKKKSWSTKNGWQIYVIAVPNDKMRFNY